jgi:hypothetical protein
VATHLDIQDIPGVKAGDVIGAHAADIRVQVIDSARSALVRGSHGRKR